MASCQGQLPSQLFRVTSLRAYPLPSRNFLAVVALCMRTLKRQSPLQQCAAAHLIQETYQGSDSAFAPAVGRGIGHRTMLPCGDTLASQVQFRSRVRPAISIAD